MPNCESRWLSLCCPNNGGGATNVFQSNLRAIFVGCSLYLVSISCEIFKGKIDGEILLRDGVDGSDSVSGRDENVVSDEVSIGSLTKLGSPCE